MTTAWIQSLWNRDSTRMNNNTIITSDKGTGIKNQLVTQHKATDTKWLWYHLKGWYHCTITKPICLCMKVIFRSLTACLACSSLATWLMVMQNTSCGDGKCMMTVFYKAWRADSSDCDCDCVCVYFPWCNSIGWWDNPRQRGALQWESLHTSFPKCPFLFPLHNFFSFRSHSSWHTDVPLFPEQGEQLLDA